MTTTPNNNAPSQKTITSSITSICVVVFAVIFFGTAGHLFAEQTTESPVSRYQELKQNISTRAEDVKKLEAEIAEYKQQLEVVGGEKKTLQSAIQTLDLTRAKLGKDAQLTQVKIAHANGAIAILSTEIIDKEERIEKNKELTVNIIKKINETDAKPLIEIYWHMKVSLAF
jgi:septal ring factor EnvC (AmiA/AmiB activator)